MLARTEANGKWALLIGIDKYKYPEVNQLFGCVNDVELMSKILQENFNFPCDRITLLQNEEATRDNILAAMDALVDNVGEDDIVVIHYSGHGSQMTDREEMKKMVWMKLSYLTIVDATPIPTGILPMMKFICVCCS